MRIACSGCGAPVSRIADVGNPWLDAGIVPFSTLHFREDPEHWARWFPADFITESFPGQFRNWFYSMLAMSTVLRREEPFKAIFGYATGLRRGRPPDAQELGQRHRVRRGGRPDGRRRHALDVRQGAPGGEHPLRLARRRRGAARAARALERLRLLRALRPAGRLEPGRGGASARPSATSSIAGSSRGRRPRRPMSGRTSTTSMPAGRPGRCRASSTTCRPGTCGSAGGASHGRPTRPSGRAPSPRCTPRS